MEPYHAPPFEGYVDPSSTRSQEEVIFSLTERLRDRESDIRHLRQEKSELENQLLLRGNPIHLDAAYEELLAHLKQREEDFRTESKRQEERLLDLERENRKLKDKAHTSRKLVDEQVNKISVMEKDAGRELETLRQRLRIVMSENEEMDRQIAMLETTVDDLTAEADRCRDNDRQIVVLEDMIEGYAIEADHCKEKETEDKIVLARLGDQVKKFRRDQHDLEVENDELQKRVATQHQLLREKEQDILALEKLDNQREEDLNAELDRMSRKYEDIIAAHQYKIQEREKEIHMLNRQCEKYENLIDETRYITNEQRAALQAKKREIEQLSDAIERSHNAGLLSQLDNMCSSQSRPKR